MFGFGNSNISEHEAISVVGMLVLLLPYQENHRVFVVETCRQTVNNVPATNVARNFSQLLRKISWEANFVSATMFPRVRRFLV